MEPAPPLFDLQLGHVQFCRVIFLVEMVCSWAIMWLLLVYQINFTASAGLLISMSVPIWMMWKHIQDIEEVVGLPRPRFI